MKKVITFACAAAVALSLSSCSMGEEMQSKLDLEYARGYDVGYEDGKTDGYFQGLDEAVEFGDNSQGNYEDGYQEGRESVYEEIADAIDTAGWDYCAEELAITITEYINGADYYTHDEIQTAIDALYAIAYTIE